MLKTALVHPEVLRALAMAGHGARVLVADGNYPISTESPATAEKVFLNLRPGMIDAIAVLETLLECVPVESALVMVAPGGQPVPVHETFRRMLPPAVPVTGQLRRDFYLEAKLPATTLVIATGEERRFASILLTIGVVVSTKV